MIRKKRRKKENPVPCTTYREEDEQTGCLICISPLDTRACARSHTRKAPSFKVEVEGLLELVACDCVLMKERLRRGDKAAGRGWEVLAGIRIIIRKKPCLQKKNAHNGRGPLLSSSTRPFISPSAQPIDIPALPPPRRSPTVRLLCRSRVLAGMWIFFFFSFSGD